MNSLCLKKLVAVSAIFSFSTSTSSGRIPENSPKGRVLASVPGTIQASDAVMLIALQLDSRELHTEVQTAPSFTVTITPYTQETMGTSIAVTRLAAGVSMTTETGKCRYNGGKAELTGRTSERAAECETGAAEYSGKSPADAAEFTSRLTECRYSESRRDKTLSVCVRWHAAGA
jgi:hypothetical protein